MDWIQDEQPTKEQAFSKLLSRIHPGAVVLLHSTSSTNAAILDELLTKWEEMGYHFAPLSELADKLDSVDLSSIPAATITLKVVLDGKTYLPVSAKVGFDMDTITYEGIEIELTKFDFAIDFTSYDAVDIKVPDEALDAK